MTNPLEIWRVNLRTKVFTRSAAPETWIHLGGRGLTAKILLDEVPPVCEPLGPHNKLIFAPGLLCGHRITSFDRISIGGKSPLTGGIKESNAGGTTALHMSLLGIKALILEEIPESLGWVLLEIDREGLRIKDATKLSGLGVYETAETLVGEYGTGVAMSIIGPGGEAGYLSAGIMNLDKDHNPTRICARGGLGAVMGAKGVKAIIFDSSSTNHPETKDLELFSQTHKRVTKAILDNPQSAVYRDYGTAGNTAVINMLGGLPTCGFSSGRNPEYKAISGEIMRDLLLERQGEARPSHPCMAGCVIQSSNVYAGVDGKKIVAPLEYETIGLMGSNLGFTDLDFIARLNWEVNDLGLDTIELGAAIGVAGRAGIFHWGDRDQILDLLEEVRSGTPLGRMLASGAGHTGKALGIREVPVVKNQAMAAYDPRAIKGTGVTYATSPMGADHTCGVTFRAKVDHLDPHGQAELSRKSQINMAGYDTLGICIFAGFGIGTVPETLSELLNAKYGWQVEPDILQKLGMETLKMEREFNRLAGFSSKDDRIPEWMTTQSLPEIDAVFDVPETDLDGVFNW